MLLGQRGQKPKEKVENDKIWKSKYSRAYNYSTVKFSSRRLVRKRRCGGKVEERGLRFYPLQIWIRKGGCWSRVLREDGLGIKRDSVLHLWEERHVEGVVGSCLEVRLRRWAVLMRGYLHLTRHAGWQNHADGHHASTLYIQVRPSPDTCRSIPGTPLLRTSCSRWPGWVLVSARSSGSSRSVRCSWGAVPCLGRSRAVPSRSCMARSSAMLRTDNLRRKGEVAGTRWLLWPETVFTVDRELSLG